MSSQTKGESCIYLSYNFHCHPERSEGSRTLPALPVRIEWVRRTYPARRAFPGSAHAHPVRATHRPGASRRSRAHQARAAHRPRASQPARTVRDSSTALGMTVLLLLSFQAKREGYTYLSYNSHCHPERSEGSRIIPASPVRIEWVRRTYPARRAFPGSARAHPVRATHRSVASRRGRAHQARAAHRPRASRPARTDRDSSTALGMTVLLLLSS